MLHSAHLKKLTLSCNHLRRLLPLGASLELGEMLSVSATLTELVVARNALMEFTIDFLNASFKAVETLDLSQYAPSPN